MFFEELILYLKRDFGVYNRKFTVPVCLNTKMTTYEKNYTVKKSTALYSIMFCVGFISLPEFAMKFWNVYKAKWGP